MPQVFFIGRHITDVWMDRGINLCCFRQNRGAVFPCNLIVHIYFFTAWVSVFLSENVLCPAADMRLVLTLIVTVSG